MLQVVNATTTTRVSSSSTTFASTGLTASITPTAVTSKVLILFSVSGYKSTGNINNALNLRLMRGVSNIAKLTEQLGYTGTAIDLNFSFATSYLDSPATTSSTTYTIEMANAVAASLVRTTPDTTVDSITLMEIGA